MVFDRRCFPLSFIHVLMLLAILLLLLNSLYFFNKPVSITIFVTFLRGRLSRVTYDHMISKR
jgi:hypothetical protein